MRAESESFRNWKITRDREMAKLKDQDRKRENDMARMQQMFGKKHNVLKRKVEETIATNKRLRVMKYLKILTFLQISIVIVKLSM